MTLTVNITNGHALVMKSIMNSKKSKVMVYLPFIKRYLTQLHITNKTERFSFQSGHAMRVVKLIKEDGL